jgi:hypothetical protein
MSLFFHKILSRLIMRECNFQNEPITGEFILIETFSLTPNGTLSKNRNVFLIAVGFVTEGISIHLPRLRCAEGSCSDDILGRKCDMASYSFLISEKLYLATKWSKLAAFSSHAPQLLMT